MATLGKSRRGKRLPYTRDMDPEAKSEWARLCVEREQVSEQIESYAPEQLAHQSERYAATAALREWRAASAAVPRFFGRREAQQRVEELKSEHDAKQAVWQEHLDAMNSGLAPLWGRWHEITAQLTEIDPDRLAVLAFAEQLEGPGWADALVALQAGDELSPDEAEKLRAESERQRDSLSLPLVRGLFSSSRRAQEEGVYWSRQRGLEKVSKWLEHSQDRPQLSSLSSSAEVEHEQPASAPTLDI